MNDFANKSYEKHRSDELTDANKIPSILNAPSTIDALRHERMYNPIAPLLRDYPSASWLTVGDSGADAAYLIKHVQNVTASSLTTLRIDACAGKGFLDGVIIESHNAEKLAKDDNSVDFIMCKEAFHHFPRPMIAFYEMVRVARLGVVFCEPFDDGRKAPLTFLVNSIKRLLRQNDRKSIFFEPAGNFIYRFSLNEIYKSAVALQLSEIYYKPLSDFYYPRLVKMSKKSIFPMLLFWQAIYLQNVLCTLRLTTWGRVIVVVTMTPLNSETRAQLQKEGFRSLKILENPYV